jgi:hypothetical protein
MSWCLSKSNYIWRVDRIVQWYSTNTSFPNETCRVLASTVLFMNFHICIAQFDKKIPLQSSWHVFIWELRVKESWKSSLPSFHLFNLINEFTGKIGYIRKLIFYARTAIRIPPADICLENQVRFFQYKIYAKSRWKVLNVLLETKYFTACCLLQSPREMLHVDFPGDNCRDQLARTIQITEDIFWGLVLNFVWEHQHV